MKDKFVEKLIKAETKRQQETLNLIPSENLVSLDVLSALGSPLTNKYSEGYPGKRYYGGNEVIDKIELLAQKRARDAFRLGSHWHVNVQPYSGSPANMAVFYALLELGDTIMGLDLPFGGHLTHGFKNSFSAKLYRSTPYKLDQNGLINYDSLFKLAKKHRPKIIISGATAYSRKFNFKKFRAIADEVGAYHLADISHITGLIIAGVHPSPFPHADVVTSTTHKTLRGPRGGIVLANTKSKTAQKFGLAIQSAIDKAIIPGLQGGPHNHQTAAIAVCLAEAQKPNFKQYGKQVVRNSRALALALKNRGYSIISGGTDNHLMLLNLIPLDITGREAEDRCGQAGLVVNRNTIPNEPRSPFNPSGVRIGTPTVTTRGMKEKEMILIAKWLDEAIQNKRPLKSIARDVWALCRRFPLIYK